MASRSSERSFKCRFAARCPRCDREVASYAEQTVGQLAGHGEISIRCDGCERTVRGEVDPPGGVE